MSSLSLTTSEEKYARWYRQHSAQICEQTVDLPSLILLLLSKNIVGEGALKPGAGVLTRCDHLYRYLGRYALSRIDEVIACLEESRNSHVANHFRDFKGMEHLESQAARTEEQLTEQISGLAIGIDLGMAYTRAAVYMDGAIAVIRNSHGNTMTPNYVAFLDTSIIVGEVPEANASVWPTFTVFDIMRFIGRQFDDFAVRLGNQFWPFAVVDVNGEPHVEIKGKTYPPEDICGEILKEMKRCAEFDSGGSEVKNAVISVPSFLHDQQRQAIARAGNYAGIKDVQVTEESTATIMAYRFLHRNAFAPPRRVLIFHLDSKYFHTSLHQISTAGSRIPAWRQLAVDTQLMGSDVFDMNVQEYCATEFLANTGVDLYQAAQSTDLYEHQETTRMMRCLRNKCEEKIKDLCSLTEVKIAIDSIHGSRNLSVILTRQKFEELNQCLFDQMLRMVDEMLSKVPVVAPSQIDNIVLVGGSSRIPKIQKMLSERFAGAKLNDEVHPEEVVAIGAAVQAAVLCGKIVEKNGGYMSV